LASHLVDVLELGVSVAVLSAFEPLPIALEALSKLLLEQSRDHLHAGLMSEQRELSNDVSLAP